MIPSSPSEQRHLLDLQGLDTDIRQLEHRRANLPEQKALDGHLDTHRQVQGELVAIREELEQLERNQKRHEEEIAQIDARRKSEEGRMYSGAITSEREVDAIRGELSTLRSRKADLEDVLLDIMERVESLGSQREALEERDAELTSGNPTLTSARDEAAKEIDEQLAERRGARERVIGELSPELVEYYEELRVRKGGLAVAELRGRTCAGCNLDLTPIELEETREEAQRGFPKCPQCDRLIVVG